MATISDGVVTVVPDVVTEWSDTHDARTVVHPILSRADPDVTLRPSARATGTLRLFFADPDDALTALALHTTGAVLVLTDDPGQVPDLSMRYVVSGAVVRSNADPHGDHWTLDVTYQVVPS